MTFKKQFITAIATGAVLLNALAPMAFADDVTVAGNGAFSTNAAVVTNANTNTTTQTNTAVVTNTVVSSANSGGNTSSFNTGGDSTIHTGDATNNVGVSTAVNANIATNDCGCVTNGGTDVKIAGNGAFSTNGVVATNANTNTLTQTNAAVVGNTVVTSSNSGGNSQAFNTGGNSAIVTGNAVNNVGVSTVANANVASLGGSSAVVGNGGNSVQILGNGAFSHNAVVLADLSTTTLSQANIATVTNTVVASANSGLNTADFNTGGDVTIATGNAKNNVGIQNLLNFNSADLDCGCVLGGGTSIKIADNGAFSINGVSVTNLNTSTLTQANIAAVFNSVVSSTNSGLNASAFNTTGVNGDPSIVTGDAVSTTDISTAGNVNLSGDGVSLSLPGNWNLGVNFDLLSLWILLHGFVV